MDDLSWILADGQSTEDALEELGVDPTGEPEFGYAVIHWRSGLFSVWEDHGDVAFGSPEYAVVAHARTRARAQDIIKDRKERELKWTD
jgi:hypothetical protein